MASAGEHEWANETLITERGLADLRSGGIAQHRTRNACSHRCRWRSQVIPFGSRNASEDAKLFFGHAIQKIVA